MSCGKAATRSEHVRELLEEGIATGTFPPGMRLDEVELARDGRTVADDERSVAPRGASMESPRDQLLPGARFAADHHPQHHLSLGGLGEAGQVSWQSSAIFELQ